jgi:hypothetical protein
MESLMSGSQLLNPGAFPYNGGNQPGFAGQSSFASVMAQNMAALLPSGLAAANVGVVQSGLAIGVSGTNQANAVPVTSNFMVFSGVPSSGSVILTTTVSGVVEILNRGTVNMQAYPPVSGQIESLGTNTAVVIASGTNAKFLWAGTGLQFYEP